MDATSYKPNFAFLIIVIIACLLVPKVMEGITSLTNTTTSTPGYEGDGILLGDSGTIFPFLNFHWTVTQQPLFLDTFHTVSIYAMPLNVARRNIFLYRSNFSANNTFQVQGRGVHSVGERIYVYLLSNEYLNPGQEASALINVEVLTKNDSEALTAPIFQFRSRQAFSDFIDLEPGAVNGAVGCKCMIGDAIKKKCKKGDCDCIERLRIESGCPSLDLCPPASDGVFTSDTSAYYFFASNVTENSTVRYDTDLLMYFYNTSTPDFEHYFVCTIRGTDSCSFQTEGVFKFSKSWDTRRIIIAYTDPTTIPASATTHLTINRVLKIDRSLVIFLVCALIVYLILRHCFHFIGYLRHTRVE